MGKPGRKRSPLGRAKAGLSSDARIILALLKKQPQNKEDLCKSAHVKISTFYRVCRVLEDLKVIKKTEDGYALFSFRKLEKDIEDALVLLKEAKSSFSVEELASEVGIPWPEIEPMTFNLLRKHNVRIVSKREGKFIEDKDGGVVLL